MNIIGALDYESGETIHSLEEQFTAREFEAFLRLLLKKCPNEKIVVILDNARLHHAKCLEEFLKENESLLELVFLPPYSPDLNMIEELWGWLKETVVNNVFYEKAMHLTAAVQTFFRDINKTPQKTAERLCFQF